MGFENSAMELGSRSLLLGADLSLTTHRYKLDSSFLRLPASEVLTLLQASLEKLRAQTEALETERDECEEGMTKLKAVLYAKFGSECLLRSRGTVRRRLTLWLESSSFHQPGKGRLSLDSPLRPQLYPLLRLLQYSHLLVFVLQPISATLLRQSRSSAEKRLRKSGDSTGNYSRMHRRQVTHLGSNGIGSEKMAVRPRRTGEIALSGLRSAREEGLLSAIPLQGLHWRAPEGLL